MNFAFIGTEGIPGNYGGFETFVENISYRLTQLGHEVTVFQPKDYQVELNNTKYENIHIEYVKAPKNKYFRAILKRIDAYRKVGDHFDVLHNFGTFPYIFKLFNKKGLTVTTIDGFEWKRASYNSMSKKIIKRNYLKLGKFPDIPISDSRIIQEYFEENGIKTHFLPYGTNFYDTIPELNDKFRAMGLEKNNYIYFVGRFVPEKNIKRLIRDFIEIKAEKKLVLIGKGLDGEDYENEIMNMARGNNNIIFTGPLYGEDYKNIIINSSGYISASKLEGTSPALLDALGARKKVLVSNIMENKATLNNLGHYYQLDDKQKALERLEKFCLNSLYSNSEYKKLMEFVIDTYSWDNIVQSYLNLIKNHKIKLKKT